MQTASFNDFEVYPCFVIIHCQEGIITPFLAMTFQIPNIYLANFIHFIIKYSALFPSLPLPQMIKSWLYKLTEGILLTP